MSRALVVVEGMDDVRALREIFCRCFDMRVQRDAPRRFDIPPLASEDGARTVYLVNGKNRESAGTRAVEAIQERFVSDYDRIGLVFDPDHHEDVQWRAWCSHLLVHMTCEVGDEVWTVRHGEDEVPFVPVPWDAGDSFDALDGKLRNLERVALAVAHRAVPEDTALVDQFLSILRTAGRKVSWKTAFRLLHALRKPDSDAGIMDQIFGQDRALRACVAEILDATRLFRRLRYLADAAV